MIRHTATVTSIMGGPFSATKWRAACPTCDWKGCSGTWADATAEARHHNDTAQPLEATAASQAQADEDGSRNERTWHAFARGLEGVEKGAEARRRLDAALSALARMDTLRNRSRIEPAPPAFSSED